MVRIFRASLDALGFGFLPERFHLLQAGLGRAGAFGGKGGFDMAILDVNLGGETAWPVARKLREMRIPFVIATGGHVEPPPAEFANVPMIEKPYTVDRVSPAIEAALAG